MKLVELAHFTGDVAAMTAFYRSLLGSEPAYQSGDMAVFQVGETKVFIHRTYVPGAGELPPEDHTAFAVERVDEVCQALQAAGLAIEVPPQDTYWGRSAYLRDPDGNLIELTQAEAA